MADIRIKDLTTTASSTASDDFIAVDGATNGTRKLNAYSPTFGGNATVAGTLTVSGTGTSAFSGPITASTSATNTYLFDAINTNAAGYSLIRFENTGASGRSFDVGLGGATSGQAGLFYIYDNLSFATRLSISSAGTISLPTTTASTSTSTGALVVSGGVGVAGAINAGGDSIINGTLTSNKNIGAGSLTAGSASNLIETSKVLSSNVLNSSIVMIAVSGSNGSDGGYCGYYMLNLVRQFGTYSVTVISSALPHNASSSYSFTWSLDANYLKVTAGKTTGLNYNYFTLTGSQTA